MRSVPLPFLSKITLLWTRAREPGPVSPVKVDSPLPFPWTQRGEIYTGGQHEKRHPGECLFYLYVIASRLGEDAAILEGI